MTTTPRRTPRRLAAVAAVSVAEDGGTNSYTVRLDTRPTGTVSISVSSSDTSIPTVSSSSLSFTTSDWSAPQTVTVTGVDDDEDNPNDSRTATINHSVTGGGYGDVSAASVTVTVTDDDPKNATPPSNVRIDGNSRITWNASTVSVPGQKYVIRWARGKENQRPRAHELCNTDAGRADFACGVAVYPENELCNANGRCQYTLDPFYANRHYAVRVRTMVREPTETWGYARHTP